MDIRKKRKRCLALLLCVLPLLGGCRVRITGENQAASVEPATETGAAVQETAPNNPGDPKENEGIESLEAGRSMQENPNAPRKEYDENASAEIADGANQALHQIGQGQGAPNPNAEAETRANQVNQQAEKTAEETVASMEAEQRGVSPDAQAADSALTYFNVLLEDRMGSLFECKRLDAYWETAQDHVTIHKSSPEHGLILNAGLYDVSARLLPENVRVDDGWVARKNPGVIVKIVEGNVLGSGAFTDAAAKSAYQQLVNRPGWMGIDAVKNRRVLLISEELLENPYLQTVAMLLMAKTAQPNLFADVQIEEALQMLTQEATGLLPSGILYYSGQD